MGGGAIKVAVVPERLWYVSGTISGLLVAWNGIQVILGGLPQLCDFRKLM